MSVNKLPVEAMIHPSARTCYQLMYSGYPVLESPILDVGEVLLMQTSCQLIVRELAHFDWQVNVWWPLLARLRTQLYECLSSATEELELRLFGSIL